MRWILVIPAFMLAADLLWWWRAHCLLRPLKSRWRMGLALFSLTQVALLAWIVGSRIITDNDTLAAPLAIVTYLWHFLILPVALLLLVVQGIGAVIAKAKARAAAGAAWHPPSPGLTRREFLGAVAAGAPPLLTLGATSVTWSSLDDFRVRRIEVPLASLPPELEGLSIAHVSDAHVGRFTGGRVLRHIVDATNALDADLICMTGDLINHHQDVELPEAIEMVQALRARHGVYLCEGNHDLFGGRLSFANALHDADLALLVNQEHTLHIRGRRVQLLGLRWGANALGPQGQVLRGDEAVNLSVQRLLPLRHDNAFSILLAHHPHAFEPAAAAEIPLTLSGHTHGGQLMLTPEIGFGPAMFRYWSGLYQQANSALVVSNGVGNWFPLRLSAPAEILHLVLRRAPRV